MFDWFLKTGVRQGVFWALLIYLVGSLNDVLMKILGTNLHFIEIVFFRFLFSAITVLIIIMFSQNRWSFLKTNMHGMHAARGIIGAIALAMCCLGLSLMPLAENTVILFAEAVFILPLAALLLKEKVSSVSIIATIIGLIGIVTMYRPGLGTFNIVAVVPTIGAILFAIMSIMVKIMVNKKEPNITMLFYFGIYTTAIAGIFVPFFWVTPNAYELLLIFLLGIGANLIQLFLFLAYRATQASTVSPIRYTELLFAVMFGYLIFGQVPDITTIIGASLIICSSLFASYKKQR